MKVYKYLIIALLAFTSCSKAVEKSSTEKNATFVVDPISATSESDKTNQNNISSSRSIYFKACVKDVAMLEPIYNQSFTVLANGNEIASLTTDPSGCLRWNEKFTYNALEQEHYIEIFRTIEARGDHSGKQELHLAVNPWKSNADAVIDLRFQQAPKEMQLSQSKSELSNSLVIEAISVNLNMKNISNGAARVATQLSFEPKTRRLAIDGAQTFERLAEGNFKIKFQVVAQNAKDIFPISVVEEQEVKIENGMVNLWMDISYLRNISPEDILRLYIEIQPINAPSELKPISGIVMIGRAQGMSASAKNPINVEPVTFLENNKDTIHAGDQRIDFILGKIQIEKILVSSMDENQQPNGLQIFYKACLKNSLSFAPIVNSDFLVSTQLGKYSLTTDSDQGCLHWKEPISFDHYSSEQYFRREISVQSKNSFYGDSKQSRLIYINPWQNENTNLALLDEKYDGAPSDVDFSDKKTQILLSAGGYSYQNKTFQIDPLLNLSTTRTYRFTFEPLIRRMTVNGWRDEKIGGGKFRIYFLLESADPSFPQVIDSQVVDVVGRGNVLTTTVDFNFKDLRFAMARSVLSVEIEPIGEQSIVSQPLSAVFDPINGFLLRFEEKNNSIKSRVSMMQMTPDTIIRYGSKILKDALKATEVDEAQMKSLGLSTQDFDAYFETADAAKISKLCGLFYDPNGWFSSYKSCVKKPNSYLNLVVTQHPRKIYSSNLGKIDITNLIMNAGMSYSENESETNSNGSSWDISAGVMAEGKLPGLNELGIELGGGISAGKSWHWSKTYSKGNNKSVSNSTELSKRLEVSRIPFEINADIEKCIEINDKKSAPKGPVYQFCSKKYENKIVRETYYYMQQDIGNNAISDPSVSIDSRPLLILLRGTGLYKNFIDVARNASNTINLSSELPSPAQLYMQSQVLNDGYYPGLLSNEK